MAKSSIVAKLIFGTTFGMLAAGGLASPAPANAFVITIASGPAKGFWDIKLLEDRFNSNQNLLQGQLWWDNKEVANTLASAFLAQGGSSDPVFSGLTDLNFAWDRSGNTIQNETAVFSTASVITGQDAETQFQAIENYATAEFTEIPGPIPVLGAFAAFGWSRRMRQRIRTAELAAIDSQACC